MINDAVSELPLVEITLPANVRGTSVVQSQFRFVKEQLDLIPKAVLGDSEYDSAKMIESIVKELHARARIAKNIRGGGSPSVTFSPSGASICMAGFLMVSRGNHPYCPRFHPQFLKGSSCYKNIRIDVDEGIRQSIDYGSEGFRKDYNRRTSRERIFSRLLSLLIQSERLRDYMLQSIIVSSLILPFWRFSILPILSKNQIKLAL